MLAGFDSSSFQPSAAQIAAAYQQGIRVVGGYLPGPGIYSGHSQSYFARLKAGGMRTIAYCSGNADPSQQKALGAAWGVDYICLDVEGGIRGDGPWVQGWLDASGAGLYGNPPVFNGRRAPFFIMADYLGSYPNYTDPKDTWLGAPPSVPHGWQWAGSVDAYGGGVDLSWLDDWFAQGDDLTPEQAAQLDRIDKAVQAIINDTNYGLPKTEAAVQFAINDGNVGLVAIKAELDKLAQGGSTGDLSGINQKLDRIIAELHTP